MPLVSLGDLQQRVWARVDNNTRLYPRDRVTSFVNEGIRICGLLTGLFQNTIQFTSQKNRVYYNLQGMGLVYPSRVQFGNQYLEKTSFLQLGRGKPNYVTDTTFNTLSGPSSWWPYGFNIIGIHPADSYGGENIYVTGASEPPQLAYLDDTININNAFMAAFDEYATFSLILKESPKTFAQASTNYNAFMKLIKKMTIYRSFIAPNYWVAESSQPIKRT